MIDAEYLLGRAARLHDLARRARNPADRRYLMWRAAEAALLAETMERVMETKPDEAKENPGGPTMSL